MFDNLEPFEIIKAEYNDLKQYFFKYDSIPSDKKIEVLKRLTNNFTYLEKFNAYISSSVRRWIQCNYVRQTCTKENIVHKPEIILTELNILKEIATHKTIPYEYVASYKVHKNICPNFPEWFGTMIDITVVSAFCGSKKPFIYFSLNQQDPLVELSEEMDYAALYGGDMVIIEILEQAGLVFTHFEACVKSHKNDILKWGLLNYKCSVVDLLKTATMSLNVGAIFIIKPYIVFIPNDINAVILGALALVHRTNDNRFLNESDTKLLENHKYKKIIDMLNNPKFPFDKLKELYLKDIDNPSSIIKFETNQPELITKHPKISKIMKHKSFKD